MTGSKRKSRGFTIFIIILVILLMGAVALFVYGSMNNGLTMPRLRPNLNGFALRTLLLHG